MRFFILIFLIFAGCKSTDLPYSEYNSFGDYFDAWFEVNFQDPEFYCASDTSFYICDIDKGKNSIFIWVGIQVTKVQKRKIYRPEFVIETIGGSNEYTPYLAIIDPFYLGSYQYPEIKDTRLRIVLSEKYRYNMGENSDSFRTDIDGDGVSDLLIYSLKKTSENTFYCMVELKLSKTKKIYDFYSNPQ